MSRGSSKLFNNFFEKSSASPVTTKKKGRSAALDSLRNNLIVDRYYFYGTFTEKRYAVILERLCEEFFLSESRVTAILNNNYEKLIQIKEEAPAKSAFKRKWHFYNWDIS
jgi:hypothetical protein